MPEPKKHDNLSVALGGTFGAVLGVVFYILDCALIHVHGEHKDVSFLKSGIYEGGPFGFLASAVVFVCGIGYLGYSGIRYIRGDRS